jgi:hypothetical protein
LGQTTWEYDNCSLVGDVRLTDANHNPLQQWVGCRAGYFPETQASPDSLFILELMAAGQPGSFALPGKGWLTITLNGSQPTGPVQVTPGSGGASPADLPVGSAEVIYYPPSGGLTWGTGSLDLRSLSMSSDALHVEAGVSVQFAAATASYAVQGTVETNWSPPPPAPSSTGPSGCSDSGASCEADPNVRNWKGICDNSGGIGPCYCAAAAEYKCFYDHGCYAEAGAPTSVSASELTTDCRTSVRDAAGANTPCGFSCP